MIVIGIDPGIEKTGFSILKNDGGEVELLDSGCIFTSKNNTLPERLVVLSNDLAEVLKRWGPAVAAVEELFFSKNVKTALTVCHARGVILKTLSDHGVEIVEFNPGQIKTAVTGDNRADKKQMQKMVQFQLGITLKNDDTVDAIAGGICLLTTWRRELRAESRTTK